MSFSFRSHYMQSVLFNEDRATLVTSSREEGYTSSREEGYTVSIHTVEDRKQTEPQKTEQINSTKGKGENPNFVYSCYKLLQEEELYTVLVH